MTPDVRRALACCLLFASGCYSPLTLRLPTWFNSAPEIERAQQQYHDPYPDAQMGPSTGFRPILYEDQRPLPVRIREKADGSRLREQLGMGVPGPALPPPGTQYPAVVPF